MSYEFLPAQYIGNAQWRGTFVYTVLDHPIITGCYELFMFTGTEGTLTLKDTPGGHSAVGSVNFATREMTYHNVTFHP